MKELDPARAISCYSSRPMPREVPRRRRKGARPSHFPPLVSSNACHEAESLGVHGYSAVHLLMSLLPNGAQPLPGEDISCLVFMKEDSSKDLNLLADVDYRDAWSCIECVSFERRLK